MNNLCTYLMFTLIRSHNIRKPPLNPQASICPQRFIRNVLHTLSAISPTNFGFQNYKQNWTEPALNLLDLPKNFSLLAPWQFQHRILFCIIMSNYLSKTVLSLNQQPWPPLSPRHPDTPLSPSSRTLHNFHLLLPSIPHSGRFGRLP